MCSSDLPAEGRPELAVRERGLSDLRSISLVHGDARLVVHGPDLAQRNAHAAQPGTLFTRDANDYAARAQVRTAAVPRYSETRSTTRFAVCLEGSRHGCVRWYGGRRHYSGWCWAVTASGCVVYESRLELARIVLVDRDPDVVAMVARPVWLAELDDSRVIQTQAVVPGSRRCRSRA